MKKFLNRGMSLLLALSLLVGMMTVGASAIDDNVTAPDPKLQTAFTVQFTFNDAIFGALEATLTVDTEAETYKLYYEHSFGATDVQGWYIPNGEEMIVGVTSGVDGVFLTADAVTEAVAPELLKLYQENGLSTERKEYDPETCEHRWLNGVCAACGTVCEHPAMTDGTCPDCGYICDHADHDKDSLICNVCGKRGHHTFVDGVCTGCGATTSYATDLESISGLLASANQQGTIEKITYTTYQYDETGNRGEAFENSAYIYLPYNYDPNQQYNILYLMHGGGGVAESWLIQDAPETPNLLDNMIASGYCDPTIVVTPTFNQNSVYVYGYELMNDLIPVVEAKYATYANGDVTPENLKATRAHRAYAGLSMGSILSWNAILKYSTDYFGYVGSYSAGPDAGSDDVCMELVDEIAASLKASGNEIYYWFNANGLRDMAHDPHLFSYYYMVETYPELFQDGVNSSWIDYLDGQHDWPWWQLDLYNSMRVFFKANMPEETEPQTVFTVHFTFNDAIFGPLDATLTVDTEAETYRLYYEHSFGATDVQGWYVPNGDEMIVGVTSGVDGVFLTEDAVVEAVAPELLKLYRDNGLSTERKEYDPATCEHRWLDGVCAACGTVCEHPEMTDGVCPTCGYVCDHADHDKDSLICNICGKRGHHTFVDGVCTGCGATTSYAMDLESISDLLVPSEQQGTIEKITYTTYQYDEAGNRGEAFENSAYIYLPYNYDPNQQYNILYLMHGGGGVAESWLIQDAPETPNLLDNMIASGYCEPTIVVTPTFNQNSVYVYGYELMNDLIPVVEAKYATYANGDVTPENLKATRAHRAYAGLSMGSILSWNAILKYSTDYFGYVGSYSAGPDAGSDDVCMELVDEIAASLKASGNEIYYWFNANGLRDMAHDPHLFSYFYMVETYPELFQNSVNSSWIDYLDGQHDWPWWQLDLYNTMQVFFKVNMPEEETKPDQPSTEPDQPGEEPDQSGTEPNQPGEEPDQPGTESNQPNATVNHAPKTGDTSNVALCVTLVLLSLSGIAALCWKKTGLLKRRNKS